MNDQGSKKILFNKSTLFSLKAELLRKQEEVHEKKQLPQNKVANFKPPVKVKEVKTVNNEYKKTLKDNLKAVDTEELEACRKSKSALEKKAELYEHLADSAGNSQLASRFLVDFKTKKQLEPAEEEPEVGLVAPQNISELSNVDEDEWAEFTDCLGRTRKCHKSDIDLFMKRDKELMKVISKDASNNDDVGAPPEEEATPMKEKPLLVQKTNDYLQSLREKWEEKEQELLAKDRDIHYQDLLFDEARIHGVGYYSFSTDETERQKQMEELIKRRQETLKAQEQAEQVRKKRDEMMAARVAAARARQRARAGLPPEEPAKENQKDFTTCLLEFLTQHKNEADAKAKEKEDKIKEEKEKERQKLREAYIREWDLGKEGVDDKVKKFREMTQEEYVEQQRGKRIDEFAPPQTSTSGNANMFDEYGRRLGVDNVPAAKTWAEVRPRVITPPPPYIGDLTDHKQQGLYFTSKKSHENKNYTNFVKAQEPSPNVVESDYADDNKRTENKRYGHGSNSAGVPHIISKKSENIAKYSNFVKPTPIINTMDSVDVDVSARIENIPTKKSHESTSDDKSSLRMPKKIEKSVKFRNFVKPTPIVDEIGLDYKDERECIQDNNNRRNDKRTHESNSVEVAPPPTFEYYGPVLKQPKFNVKNPFESDIREAYAQGIKSLEAKPSNRQLSKQYDFCLD